MNRKPIAPLLGGIFDVDAAVMARITPPFGYELIRAGAAGGPVRDRWRIHDGNDDAIASVAGAEEGYARLIVTALNEHYRQKGEVDMLLKDLDTYLKERGVVSLHLTAEDGKYTCVARTAHGQSISASGLGSVDAVVGRVLWSLSQAERATP